MKLYTRNQVISYIIVTAAVVAAVFLAVRILLYYLPAEKEEAAVPEIFTETPAAAPVPSPSLTHDEQENILIYERLNRAVVNISTEVMTWNWFFESVPQEGGSGSGAIIDKEGYILTNKHVVEKAYKVYVTIADGTTFEGKVVGVDYENDLAVVKIEPGDRDLTVIEFGDSSALRVGQKVLAIGNPFGYERTLTTGVISGLGRPMVTSAENKYIIKDMIQTDASINPGNSGGPMIDSNGKLIGINTVIYSPSGGSVGIGFAVPVNTAKRVIPDLIAHGKVNRGWIDMEFITLFPKLVEYAKLPVSRGILVSRVERGSNADKAGLKGGTDQVRYRNSSFYLGGDIITGINGNAISSVADVYSALENTRPGDKAKLTVIRKGKEMILETELSERRNLK